MKRGILSALLCAALGLSLLSGCGGTAPASENVTEAEVPNAEPSSASSEAGETTVITFSGGEASVEGAGAKADGAEVKITASGSYRLTGASDSARVTADLDEGGAVTIILDGCELTCPDSDVLYIKNADAAVVIAEDGTENSLTSGEDAGITEADEDASGAALRAKCSLTVTGGGKLTVRGFINNGISSSGDLVIDAGILNVTAANDGLKSKADAEIRGGVITVDSAMDGIQADGDLLITDGTLNITTGGGAENAEMKVSDSAMMGAGGPGGGPGGGRGSREASQEADGDDAETASDEPIENDAPSDEPIESGAASDEPIESDAASDEAAQAGDGMPFPGMSQDQDSTTSDSRKGLKAGGDITIEGGSVLLDCADDAIHGDADVTVTGGQVEIHSADDGVHADTVLTISGGTTDVQYAYEGFEAKAILITDGLVNVIAVDDGMNVNGGNMFGPGGPSRGSDEPEEETDAAAEASDETEEAEIEPELRITGGIVYVDSGGDGLDSNGSLYIEGGEVYVSGPSTNWDAALDTGDGSGYELLVSGGKLMAGGYSGMMEAPDSGDGSQCTIYYTFSEYSEDNAPCVLKDADGNVLLECSFAHSSNCVVLSSPDIRVGGTYTLSLGDQTVQIEMTSANFSNRGGRGGMGGGSREPSAEAESVPEA